MRNHSATEAQRQRHKTIYRSVLEGDGVSVTFWVRALLKRSDTASDNAREKGLAFCAHEPSIKGVGLRRVELLAF